VQLAGFNLNHLVALDALLSERHVGRAAKRLGVTQSAMSHTLRILRESLEDPLLVRVGNDMVLSPYAEEVRARLRSGLQDLESVVSGRAAFDPSTTTDTFTFATTDGVAAGFAALLYRKLSERAPLAKFRIQVIDADDLPRQLDEGGADVAFGAPGALQEGLHGEPAGGVSYSVVCRREHPVIKKRLSLAQYCKVPHAMLSITGEGPSFVDHLLERQGMSREVRVRVPFLIALGEVVASADLIASVPSVVAEFMCDLWPLKMLPFPLPLPPVEGALVWHPRFDADPAHRFFRELVKETARELTHEDGEPRFERQAGRRVEERRH
jgi:DNA-binding transcriptional LysR family regulator